MRLLCGDVIEILQSEDDGRYTACFCDPPYGYGFMGKNWDHGVPGVNYWAEVKRVLKPGGVLMAFGGTRTWHRLACAIEDAGFEIFDCMMWLYGAGFPKSHNISKAIDEEAGELGVQGKGFVVAGDDGRKADAATWSGYGSALKPAWEPVICARKPRAGTYAQTAIEHGAGALWIDGGRIGTEGGTRKHDAPKHDSNGIYGNGLNGGGGKGREISAGRWPANLILDEVSAEMLGVQSGESKSTAQPRHNGSFDSIAKGHELMIYRCSRM